MSTRTILLGLLVLSAPLAPARSEPRMIVRNPDNTVTLVQVSRAEVSVHFTLDVAETEFLLTFYNDRDRDVEGEFTLPLPAGATVSGYALEVGDKLREGVAVEKERARTAYESVKRRMIDPGLVEREAGNLYRTRVYPIPARGTKQLRLRYTETLPTVDHRLLYSLPLRFPGKVDDFRCRLSGAGLDARAIRNPGGLGFRSDGPDCLLAELKNLSPDGTVQLAIPEPIEASMAVENPKTPVFYLRDVVPEFPMPPRGVPKKIHLTWDASGSGRNRDHLKEMEVLDAWFRTIRNTRVDLHLLRNGQSQVGEFEVKNGAWSTLRKALENIHYDGGTDLSAIHLPDDSADLALFVGDGSGSIGGLPSAAARRFVFLKSGSGVKPLNEPSLRLVTETEPIELDQTSVPDAVRRLTHIPLQLLEVRGDALGTYTADPNPRPGEPFHVSGSLLENKSGTLQLTYGCEGMDPVIHTVEFQSAAEISTTTTILPRTHAQRVLAAMEREPAADIPGIVGHCKKHGLVSDHTSFIVLERMEDYVTHGIRPPEEDLAKSYDDMVAQRAGQTPARSSAPCPFAMAWKNKVEWYQKRFPGYESLILPKLRRVAIWKQAVESQFAPDQRDAGSFSAISLWHDDACKAVARKKSLHDTKDYLAWIAEIDRLHKTGATLAKLPVNPPPPGKPLVVSVRGLVNAPGLVKEEGPLSLKQSLDKAGGLHPVGTPGRIAVYRNASRTVYNIRSKGFKDLNLFPCDMVVAESKTNGYQYACDPFSEDIERPLEEQPAVLEDMELEDAAAASPPADAAERKSLTPNAEPEILLAAPMESPAPDLATFREKLAKSKDPEALYAAVAGPVARPQQFHIEAARALFTAGHRDLATRVLTNLPESAPGDPAAILAMAWWLADAGLQQEAADLIKSAVSRNPASESLMLNLLALDADDKSTRLDPACLAEWKSGALACIAAMHATPAHASGANIVPLPADLRIEAHASDPGALSEISVTTPDGSRCGSLSSTADIHGGRISGDTGVYEYLCRKAMPGTYQVHCRASRPCTVRIRIHTQWAKPGHQSRTVTRLIGQGELIRVADVGMDFSPEGD